MHTILIPEYDAGKARYSVLKEANLIKHKYMIKETAAQNIKNLLQSSIENEKIEELKVNQCMDSSTGNLEDHQM